MKKIKNLVLSGGGIKGALTIGALKELEKTNWLEGIENVLGSSIGSFLGLLWIIGYNGEEMNKLFCDINFDDFRKVSLRTLMNDFGLDNGEDMIKLWKAIIKYKTGNSSITFQQLFDEFNKSLIISVVQLNPTKTIYLNKENEPNMPIIDAIRLSISVPIYFTPQKFKGKFYLDGSTIDHFHANYFNENEKTLYLLIYSKYCDLIREEEIDSFEKYLKFMFNSMLDFIQIGQFEDVAFNPSVLNIEYEYTKLDFLDNNIKSEEIQLMINEGENETKKYIEKMVSLNNLSVLKKREVLKKFFDLWSLERVQE